MIDYCYGLVSDNYRTSAVHVSQIANGKKLSPIASYLENKFPASKVAVVGEKTNGNSLKKSQLVICDGSSIKEALRLTEERGFILVKLSGNFSQILPDNMDIISTFYTNKDEFVLLTNVSRVLKK